VIDVPLFLVLATGASAAIWAVDVLRKGPAQRALSGARVPVAVDYAKAFFPILLAVLVLRSFVAEPFRIPSASMVPTLEVGDFILVNKYAYGLRLPVVDRKVVELGAPARGDVVVFRYPPDPRQDFIKRIVGLPGDVVEYRERSVFINGVRMPQHDGRERLGAVEHRLQLQPWVPDQPGRWVVPDGQFFVMGDNRDNSRDSRVWGFVPEANLVGRAFVVWMNWRPFASMPRWDRIGQRIE
jgi:signal peptidase I